VAWMVAEPAPNEDTNEQTQETWGFSTKNLGVMCFLIRSWSLLCAIGLIYLRNDFDGFSVRQELGADRDHLLPGLYPPTATEPLMGHANCTSRDLLSICRHVLAPHHRKPAGFRGVWNDGAEGTEGTGGCGMPLRLMDAIIPASQTVCGSIRSLLR